MKAPASAPVKKRGTVALSEPALRKLRVEQLQSVCRGCGLKARRRSRALRSRAAALGTTPARRSRAMRAGGAASGPGALCRQRAANELFASF
jgi:hypothetical protein